MFPSVNQPAVGASRIRASWPKKGQAPTGLLQAYTGHTWKAMGRLISVRVPQRSRLCAASHRDGRGAGRSGDGEGVRNAGVLQELLSSLVVHSGPAEGDSLEAAERVLGSVVPVIAVAINTEPPATSARTHAGCTYP